jgi:dipeptidyl aminopeptidase/acylaminoacyl peptidase
VGGGIAVKKADGTAEPKIIWSAKTNTWPLFWSPDGKFIVFRVQDPKSGGLDLWIAEADGSKPAHPLIATPAEEVTAAVSPDGKWMTYTSNESGRREVYVVPFPNLGEKRQVSTAGGEFSGWLGPDRIYFVQPQDVKLLAVDVEQRGSSLMVGAAQPLFGGKPLPRSSGFGLVPSVSASPDGKRLLIPVPVDDESSTTVHFVSDWVAELKRK